MPQLDLSTIVGAMVLAASNLGAAKLLLTRSLNRQDKMDEKLQDHSRFIAEVTLTLNRTVETQAAVQKSVEELYASRNSHGEKLVAIETLHTLKRCNKGD